MKNKVVSPRIKNSSDFFVSILYIVVEKHKEMKFKKKIPV